MHMRPKSPSVKASKALHDGIADMNENFCDMIEFFLK